MNITTDNILDETIRAIKENRKLNDSHIMLLLEQLKKRFIRRNTIEGSSSSKYIIRIIDPQQIKLFMLSCEEGMKRPLKKPKLTYISNDNRHCKTMMNYFDLSDIDKEGGDLMVLCPIHSNGHWSLILYLSSVDKWFYTDSKKDYHQEVALSFITWITKLTIHLTSSSSSSSHLYYPSSKSNVIISRGYCDQIGDWECGHYMIIFAGIFMECIHQLRLEDYHELDIMIYNVTLESYKRVVVMKEIINLLITTSNVINLTSIRQEEDDDDDEIEEIIVHKEEVIHYDLTLI